MGGALDVYQKIASLQPGDKFSTTRDDELDLFFWRFPNGVWENRAHTLKQLADSRNLTISEDFANNCLVIQKNA